MSDAVVAEAFGVRGEERRRLHPVTFRLEATGLALVEGPSGSGKSTLLAALAGLLPDDGFVVAEGRLDVLGRPAGAPRAPDEVAFVPQDPHDALLAGDVLGEASFRLENLGVPEREGLARARAALARFGLESIAARESASLSGGEARRVALAAAWAARPRLLVLDEPLAGLDAAWRGAVVEDVVALARETAVVVAEHRTAPFAGHATVRVATGGG